MIVTFNDVEASESLQPLPYLNHSHESPAGECARRPRNSQVHNGSMSANEHGWISYAGDGDNAHLTGDQRKLVENGKRDRLQERGELLAVVEVSVYENGCHQQVNFPHGSLLGVESDSSDISDVVARAQAELATWR